MVSLEGRKANKKRGRGSVTSTPTPRHTALSHQSGDITLSQVDYMSRQREKQEGRKRGKQAFFCPLFVQKSSCENG